MQTGLEKLSVKNPVTARLVKAFIFCTEGKSPDDSSAMPVARRAKAARKDPNWRYYVIPWGHLVVMEQPELVTKVLLDLANAR